MGRKCLFPNCQSGSRSERKFNEENNLQNKTLFSFPKDLNLRAKWKQAIGCKARPQSVICELHFNYCDIKKYDEIKINNKVVLLERKIPHLNPEAIPVPYIENKSIQSIHNGILKESLNAENINLMETEEHYVELEKLDESIFTHDVQETMKTLSHDLHETKIEQYCDDENNNSINCVNGNLSNWYHSVLMNNIKELPSGWGAVLFDNKVVIALWKLHSCIPEKQISVFNDFSIKIYFDKNEIHLPPEIHTSMNNFQDVINNINILDRLIPCDGPGDNQIKDDSCIGYVSCNKKYLRFGHYRCDHCYKRRIINKLLEKKKQRLQQQQKAKLKKKRTKLRLTNAKLQRANKKVIILFTLLSNLLTSNPLFKMKRLYKITAIGVRACHEHARLINENGNIENRIQRIDDIRRNNAIRQLSNSFHILDDRTFLNHLRLLKQVVLWFCERMEPHLPDAGSGTNSPKQLQVVQFLIYE